MKTINELQDEVIEEFSDFDDWMDKYSYLIELGNELTDIDPKYKIVEDVVVELSMIIDGRLNVVTAIMNDSTEAVASCTTVTRRISTWPANALIKMISAAMATAPIKVAISPALKSSEAPAGPVSSIRPAAMKPMSGENRSA